MANLLRTEWYKLWHSWYFWGIGIFTFLLSSILLLDSKGKTSNLVMASLYNTPLLYFLIIVFIALFIGNDLGGRTLNAYLTADIREVMYSGQKSWYPRLAASSF